MFYFAFHFFLMMLQLIMFQSISRKNNSVCGRNHTLIASLMTLANM